MRWKQMYELAKKTIKAILSKENIILFLFLNLSFSPRNFSFFSQNWRDKFKVSLSLLDLTFWGLVTDWCTSASVIGICAFTEDKRLQALLLTKCPKYPSSPTERRIRSAQCIVINFCQILYQALYIWRGPLSRQTQIASNQQNKNKWTASIGNQSLKTIVF